MKSGKFKGNYLRGQRKGDKLRRTLCYFCDIFEPGFQKSLNQSVEVGDGVMNHEPCEMKHTILIDFFINSMERTKGDRRIKKTPNFKLCSYFVLVKNWQALYYKTTHHESEKAFSRSEDGNNFVQLVIRFPGFLWGKQ